MSETKRIRWEPTEHGGFTGHVGTLEEWAFQIYKPDSEGQQWLLTAGNLRSRQADDPAALKAEAEHWLEGFVSSLGAVFPDEAYVALLAHAGPIRSALLNGAAADGVRDSNRELYIDAAVAMDAALDTQERERRNAEYERYAYGKPGIRL